MLNQEQALEELEVAAFQELLRFVSGRRSTPPKAFRSKRFETLTREAFSKIAPIETRSYPVSQEGPFRSLNVDNLRTLQGDWVHLLKLAEKGFPILWAVPTDILQRAMFSDASSIALTVDERERMVRQTAASWVETQVTYPSQGDAPELVSMVVEANQASKPEYAIPLALNVLERLVSEYCDSFGVYQLQAHEPAIRRRASSLADFMNAESAPRTVIDRSCAALIGTAIAEIFSNAIEPQRRSSGGFYFPPAYSLRRNAVTHFIRPQYLTPDNMAVTAAMVVGVTRELGRKAANARGLGQR